MEVEVQVEKLSPKAGDILVFRGYIRPGEVEEIVKCIPEGVSAIALPDDVTLTTLHLQELKAFVAGLEARHG